MALKARIKRIAKEKKLFPQIVLQNYMMERFLERMSLSPYKDDFVIKGGFLISSIVGLDLRATMDLDATIRNYPMTKEFILRMLEDICQINIEDGVVFEMKRIGDIREGDTYPGYRVSVTAHYETMAIPLKFDITTGDKIIPKEVEHNYKLMMDDRQIQVLAYNLETILAKKLETVISRGEQNTRPRDYYDLYILSKLKQDDINYTYLQDALKATSQKRKTELKIADYQIIMNGVRKSDEMNRQWMIYKNDFNYASAIDFNEACDAVLELMENILSVKTNGEMR